MKTNLVLKYKSIIRIWLFIYIDVDNPVYIDFAYTSDPRVFKVLIYWIDIESHSSRPEMIQMMRPHHQCLYSSDESGISIYFLLTGVRTKN